MIKLWLAFIILFAIFYFGISSFRKLKGKDQWDLTKTLFYSILCSLLAIASMTLIVILF
jgi:hypothetical protein